MESLWQNNPFIQLRRLAEAKPDREICAAVFSTGDGGTRMELLPNVHQKPEQAFEVDTDSYLRARQSPDFCALAHSHTADGSARLSKDDLAASDALCVPYFMWHPTEGFDYYRPKNWRNRIVGRQFIFGLQDCITLVRDLLWERRDLHARFMALSPRDMQFGRSDWAITLEELGLTQVTAPRKGAVVLFRCARSENKVGHCGYFVDDTVFCHQLHYQSPEETHYTEDYKAGTAGIWL